MDYEVPNAWRSIPRKTDRKWSELFGGEIITSKDRLWLEKEMFSQNQWIERDPSTEMGCNAFSATHGMNTMQLLEEKYDLLFWEKVRYDFVDWVRPRHTKRGWDDPIVVGSLLQDMLDYLLYKEYIIWYVKCETLKDHKEALNKGMVILTGSRNFDWRETRKAPYIAVVKPWSPGHFFCEVGYDDEKQLLHNRQSYGEAYDNDHFHTRYADIGQLYSSYALIDKRETDVVVAWKIKKQKIIDNIKGKQSQR